MNRSIRYKAVVLAEKVNSRKEVGTNADLSSFSPLKRGTSVGICDEKKDSTGKVWYFIKTLDTGKYGYISSKVLKKKLNVLFLGASTTYKPGTASSPTIPTYFAKLASKAGYSVSVTTYAISGATLDKVWAKYKQKISAKSWDIVILQEGSQYYTEYNKFKADVSTICQAVRTKNPSCTVVLRQMWYNKGTSTSKLGTLYKNAENVAKACNIPIISRDGKVMYSAVQASQSVFQADNHHQNGNGAYLCSCALYHAIFGKVYGNAYKPMSIKNCAKLQQIADKF